jgi:RNA polymerase-binding transcription factor DksA
VTVEPDARRAELVALRARMVAAAEGIVPDGEESGEMNTAAGDQHIADHASEMLEREMDWTLEENAERILDEIDDALRQLDAGTYGTCRVCGEPIPEERLAAVPYATLCLRDKRLQEGA